MVKGVADSFKSIQVFLSKNFSLCRNNSDYIYKTTKDWFNFFTSEVKHSCKYSAKLEVSNYFIGQLRRDGYCIVENFWTKDKCLDAALEVDRVLSGNKQLLHPSGTSDMRLFGAEKQSALINEFNVSIELEDIASAYCRRSMNAAFTLAAKMPYKAGNNGSGEGWHRDTFWRQFKAIIYLTDVDDSNGPFQILCNSNNFLSVISDGLRASLKFRQHRLSDEEVNKILLKSPARLKTFPAKAGTLLLVDTSSIHRGKPIDMGCRYALTNYYYPAGSIGDDMLEKFQVMQ